MRHIIEAWRLIIYTHNAAAKPKKYIISYSTLRAEWVVLYCALEKEGYMNVVRIYVFPYFNMSVFH